MLRLPPRGDGPVTVLIQAPDAFHPFQRSQLTLDRRTGEVVKWEPYANNSAGRKLRTWVRALHTGEAFGFPGQTVAGLASLGGCFLVWTGLAMAWRRLRSWRRTPEGIPAPTVIELTTEKTIMPEKNFVPIDPQLTETASAPRADIPLVPRGGNGPAQVAHDEAHIEWAAAPFNSDSVLILYGTVTGNAETVANKLAVMVRQIGRMTRVRDMAHCQASALAQASCVLVVTSTYGDGEPPDDALPFWHALVHGDGLDLRGVKFSVLALGNTTFDHFCKCGRDLDAALERHGATRFYPRVDCDVDYDAPAKTWITGVLTSLELGNHAAKSA
jgi:sulfite reductase (NADPH) flavoprotein alpha-component